MWGLPAPFPATHNHHGVVLILAFDSYPQSAGPNACALFVRDDGQLDYDHVKNLRSEWRFNWSTQSWEDHESGVQDDEAGDGSPEIPGDVPELTGADRGDPSDEGDGAPGGVVPT